MASAASIVYFADIFSNGFIKKNPSFANGSRRYFRMTLKVIRKNELLFFICFQFPVRMENIKKYRLYFRLRGSLVAGGFGVLPGRDEDFCCSGWV